MAVFKITKYPVSINQILPPLSSVKTTLPSRLMKYKIPIN